MQNTILTIAQDCRPRLVIEGRNPCYGDHRLLEMFVDGIIRCDYETEHMLNLLSLALRIVELGLRDELLDDYELPLDDGCYYIDYEDVIPSVQENGGPKYPGLREKLVSWRDERAASEKRMPRQIVTDVSLNEIAQKAPRTDKELLEIKGIGKILSSRYGEAILAVVHDYFEEQTPPVKTDDFLIVGQGDSPTLDS